HPLPERTRGIYPCPDRRRGCEPALRQGRPPEHAGKKRWPRPDPFRVRRPGKGNIGRGDPMVKRYLEVMTLDDVSALLSREFAYVASTEQVSLESATGRITAEPIFSRYSVPEIHLAAMDGIAVSSQETRGASEQHPVTLGNAQRVNTGNIVPTGFDAVIMIEDVWPEGDRFTIRKSATPWQHIRPAGEDLAESEMIVPAGHRIRSHETGALAAYGITHLAVRPVRAGLIPTGSELVPSGT